MSHPTGKPDSLIRRPALGGAAAVAVLVFVTFLPSLNAGFVDWDDDKNILENPHFRGLGWRNLRWMFTTTHMGPYQPLSWLTLAVDYSLWGLNPRGYHLTNVLLHSLGAAAMCLAVTSILSARRTCAPSGSLGGDGPSGTPRRSGSGREVTGAIVAALAWAVHPQHVESVAWVTERRDVLSGLFFFLSVWCYVEAHSGARSGPSRTRWERAAGTLFVLALLSKATVVTLPLVLLVLDVYPLRRLGGRFKDWWTPSRRHVFVEKFNYLGFALLAVVVGLIGQAQAGALRTLGQVGLVERAVIALHAVFFYLGKTFWPTGLSPLYPRPDVIRWTDPPFAVALVVVPVIVIVVFLLRRRFPGIPAAGTAYLAGILPVCGLVTLGDELVADRYSYLPTSALFVPVGGVVAMLWGLPLSGTGRRVWQGALAGGIVAVIGAAGFHARRLMLVWQDSLALWTRATQQRPDSAKAWNNLGAALIKAERYVEGEDACRNAIRRRSGYATGYYNLGVALTYQGRPAQAREALTEAIRLDPNDAHAHAALGAVLVMWLKEPAEAVKSLETALRLDPQSAGSLHYLLGKAYHLLGRYEQAAERLEKSVQISSKRKDLLAGLTLLADVYLSLNRIDAAERVAARAAELAPKGPRVHYALAQVRTRQGRVAEAIEALRVAMSKRPIFRNNARTDPHLRDLRSRIEFARLLSEFPPTSEPAEESDEDLPDWIRTIR